MKQAEQDNINTCGDAIEKVLAEFGCVMEPKIMMVIKTNPTPNLGIQQIDNVSDLLSPKPEKEEEQEG